MPVPLPTPMPMSDAVARSRTYICMFLSTFWTWPPSLADLPARFEPNSKQSFPDKVQRSFPLVVLTSPLVDHLHPPLELNCRLGDCKSVSQKLLRGL